MMKRSTNYHFLDGANSPKVRAIDGVAWCIVGNIGDKKGVSQGETSRSRRDRHRLVRRDPGRNPGALIPLDVAQHSGVISPSIPGSGLVVPFYHSLHLTRRVLRLGLGSGL
jgi:hypothetical protein